MISLIKLFLAHLIGDFLFQPKSWVERKEAKKIKSPVLYIHAAIHGALVLLLLWDIGYWSLALVIMILHFMIDVFKLYLQKENSRVNWFLIDQGLHLLSIIAVWMFWWYSEIEMSLLSLNQDIWIYVTALLLITSVSGIVIQVLMSGWSEKLHDENTGSLVNAGKYIGILERVFVFIFIVAGHWEGIGFLLAAKSVFRFGDLKESKNRKLTEYVLIGTLLSFGIAMVVGLVSLGLVGG